MIELIDSNIKLDGQVVGKYTVSFFNDYIGRYYCYTHNSPRNLFFNKKSLLFEKDKQPYSNYYFINTEEIFYYLTLAFEGKTIYLSKSLLNEISSKISPLFFQRISDKILNL